MTVRPFYYSSIFGATNFQYNLKGILAQTEYNTADDSWKWKPGSWTEKDIEAHQMQANLYADIMGKTQSLLLNADLPPEKSALSANATARAWISETNATHRIVDPFDDPTYEPVYLTETFTFHPKATLRQYAVYTPEYDSWTNLTTTLTLWDFSASFTATRSVSYYLDTTIGSSGWKQQGTDETLNPQELRLAYIKNFMTPETKKVQVGLNLNTSLAFNLQRYTMSKFTFSLGFTAKITNFLDVTMSAYSENSTIYRYFPNTASNTGMPWKNPFIDLIDSFRFDDRQKREESGFKLKSFNLDLVHHLGDWDATLNLKLIPELNNNVIPKQYEFNTEFSFLMQWKPIKQLKTKLSYDKDAGFDWE
jgi:hypothetical protein